MTPNFPGIVRTTPKLGVRVKGIFEPSITYEVREPTANWSKWFGKYENQRWEEWDSNSCWCLSSVNCLEDQLEWLDKNGMFSAEAKAFFQSNGYIDQDGDFNISERYLEILGGNLDTGGTAEEAWQLMQNNGCIPRSMLTYTRSRADSWGTKSAFNADYFNPLAVEAYMKTLGQKFLTYVKISYQKIGVTWYTPDNLALVAALKQSPLQIGIPIPKNVSWWNQVNVPYDGGRNVQHEVELYGINPNGDYLIFDQYLPNLKVLDKNYYIPFCTQGVISAVAPAAVNAIPQPTTYWQQFFQGLFHWYNGIFDSKVPIGKRA
jgi:hypothetical protein